MEGKAGCESNIQKRLAFVGRYAGRCQYSLLMLAVNHLSGHLLAHCPWLPELAAIPTIACSFMENGPGFSVNENRPKGTV